MMPFLVTVKLPRQKDHDPANKITGTCPVSGKICTDTTGQHHTILVEANSVEDAGARFPNLHITRIEAA